MANRKQLIEILQIAERYEPGETVCAEHDIIYFLPPDTELSLEDRKRLEELRCTRSEYEGWSCFV